MRNIEYTLLYILIIILLVSASIFSQNIIPSHRVDGDYIREWLILGPFFPRSLDKDFLKDEGGESNVEPLENDIVVTSKHDTITWTYHRSNLKIVDLLKAVGNYQNTVAYAYCEIYSEKGGMHRILLGSDDGVALWLNGERIHFNNVDRPLYLDNDMIEIELMKGVNTCLIKVSQGTLNWGLSMRVLPHDPQMLNTPKFFLSKEHINSNINLTSIQWKYESGDNQEWADPDFDDSSWKLVTPALNPYVLNKGEWKGVGWFRLNISVDSTLINKPLGLSFWQAGSSQFYLDGELLFSFDEESNDWKGVPKVFTFDRKDDYVIAIRYSNKSFEKFWNAGFNSGFSIHIGKLNEMTEERFQREETLIGYQMFFTGLTIAIGILHLILFLYFPTLRQNFFFALFLFSYAFVIYYDYQHSLAIDLNQHLFLIRIHRAANTIFYLLELSFLYSLFYKKMPIQFWIISLVGLGFGVLVVLKPNINFSFLTYISIAVMIEIIRVIIIEFERKREGVWIIGLAFLLFYSFGTFDALMDAGIIVPFQEMQNPYAFGSIGFFIAMSIYLSRDFARTNKRLAKQEIEKKLLEAENARQLKELEDARNLQLSMLPEILPQLTNLDISVYMKTATEVGGDYYDFKKHDDGTLTMVIGDATGHGMQAGTLVAATKSLFNALADEPDPIQFLNKSSHALKEMNLKKMFMALTIAKFKDQNVQIAAAGMPFPLLFRSKTGSVEEIQLKGMPLGGFAEFPYKDIILRLYEGDTLLFISDGYSEMFNKQNKMLGQERVKDIFKEIANNSPNRIIEHLIRKGESWANGRDQEDDITFVVIKIR